MTMTGSPRRSPAQIFSLVFGAAYVLAGLAGFLVTGVTPFAASRAGGTLIVFGLNPLHNVVHIAIGVVWLVGSTSRRGARTVNLVLGLTLGLVAILGFTGALRFLAIGSLADPDNFLHLASAALALYFGSVGAEPARAGTA
jgi:uncharacterized protein DUF4383